jgi:fumarate reductase (CoM/CoB) subunit B
MGEIHHIDIRLFRFDPDRDPSPRYTRHSMPYDEHTTIVDLLEAINDTAEPFSFQRECRVLRCGSCAVKVNGKPILACQKRIKELKKSRELVIEPLTSFPLIKDLLVDFSADLGRRIMLRPFPEAASVGLETPSPTEADTDVLRQYTACARCAICVEACAARKWPEGEHAPNPMHLLEIARLAQDPRDRASRTVEAVNEGLNLCDGCRQCDRVCPLGLSVYEISVGRLKAILPPSV